MGWLYLLAALVFPPVFILWRPRARVPAGRMKVRVAAAVVVVWMLLILWGLRASITGGGGGGGDLAVDRPATELDTNERWEVDAPSDAPLIMLLGWVPGLVYAGLLLLGRKGLEPPPVEVVGAPGPGGRRKRFSE